MDNTVIDASAHKTRSRFWILAVLFIISTVNYADRSTLSIAGPHVARDLGLDPLQMGYIFSAFGWAYTLAQLPGGWLLDKFGSKKVYGCAILIWSVFTFCQGFVHFFANAAMMLFILRFMVGFAEAPVMPANSSIVSAWFPVRERGTASAIFNISQYAALVVFNPLLGWITQEVSWEYVFTVMGVVGIVLSVVWVKTMYSPLNHPRVSQSELEYLRAGGALVEMDAAAGPKADRAPQLGYIKQLLSSRMLLGIYLANYCVNAITWFFLYWFPIYLVKGRGMSILEVGFVAALPAVCGCIGGVLGGVFSDYLLNRGYSLSVARKTPIIVGMLLCTSMVICNYTTSDVVVVAAMSLAFFGKGIGALGWTVNADTAPKQIVGLSGGVLNLVTQIGAITTPIVIGYILQRTGSFDGALIYVAANGLMVIVSYLFIVGKIQRLELKPLAA
ncbi:MFS transporter [Sodalis praecaptivus]|uniref:MFS transporter n=1 Tax=Sodalis praecaptivus TaxID=1239307 RepID=UPI0027ED5551|nr:MFS transporter [Sodalis praecaptivus]CAJ0999232.1 putative galactarate transporter [Sodalis praecaptivus]